MMTNTATAKATESLPDLPFEQLKRVMFARLHGEQSFGPITDPRVGLEPFEWLVEQFQRGDTGLRDRMTAIMGEFLNELVDLEAWPFSARSNLLDVLQDCCDTLVDDIRRLIRTQILLKLAGAGAPAHAGLLKCLISLGHRETPEFWMEQFELLGPEYGALIFSGLLDHGLDVAMRHLPRLCEHDHARQQIRLLLPVLQDEFGAERVIQTFQQFECLSKATCAAFAADLTVDSPHTSGTWGVGDQKKNNDRLQEMFGDRSLGRMRQPILTLRELETQTTEDTSADIAPPPERPAVCWQIGLDKEEQAQGSNGFFVVNMVSAPTYTEYPLKHLCEVLAMVFWWNWALQRSHP